MSSSSTSSSFRDEGRALGWQMALVGLVVAVLAGKLLVLLLAMAAMLGS